MEPKSDAQKQEGSPNFPLTLSKALISEISKLLDTELEGNPKFTLGEGSGGSGGGGAEGCGGKYVDPSDPEYMLKTMFPDKSYEDLQGYKSLFHIFESFVRECEMKKTLNQLHKENNLLKNSCEQLQRARDADKGTIRDLEQNLEDLGARFAVLQNTVVGNVREEARADLS